MHEMSIIRQAARTVQSFADENGLDHIDGLVLEIGELSLVMPDYVRKLYPIATEGTILEGSELIIEIIPGMAECSQCDEIFNVVEHEGNCPNCGSFDKEVLSGLDFTIKEVRILEPQPK